MQQQAGSIRGWTAADDVSALTGLLHLAYQPLMDSGLHYLTGRQSDAVTARRIGDGRRCWVIDSPRLLATVTLSPPLLVHGCPWYDRPDVASVGQLAVHPQWQRAGIGRDLMAHAEDAARAMGVAELAVDTSDQAHQLIRWYLRLGYRVVGQADWKDTNYLSVVLSKSLSTGATAE